MERRFADLGIIAQRIEAATENNITDIQRQLYCNPASFKWQTERELSCSISHLRAIKAFLASGARYAAIFEDDVVFSSGILEFLEKFEEESADFDLVRIGTHPNTVRLASHPDFIIENYSLHKIYQFCYGAAAYIVSKKAAQFILDSNVMLERTTDAALYRPDLLFSRKHRVYQVIPALAIQEHCLEGNIAEISDLFASRESRFRVNSKNTFERLRYYLPDLFRTFLPSLIRVPWLRLRYGVRRMKVPIHLKSDIQTPT